jgi:hypothetical protein
LGRTCYLSIVSLWVKLVGHRLQTLHCHQICNCWLTLCGWQVGKKILQPGWQGFLNAGRVTTTCRHPSSEQFSQCRWCIDIRHERVKNVFHK